MKDLQDKESVRHAWSRLLQEWRKLDDDDPEVWRKSCGWLTFYITRKKENNVEEFEFAAHGGDDEILVDEKLDAANLTTAMEQSDSLIEEFLAIGANVLKTDEFRIKQAFVQRVFVTVAGMMSPMSQEYDQICAVGTDGILYIRADDGRWIQQSMKVMTAPTAQ
jgi:hypothetical protein